MQQYYSEEPQNYKFQGISYLRQYGAWMITIFFFKIVWLLSRGRWQLAYQQLVVSPHLHIYLFYTTYATFCLLVFNFNAQLHHVWSFSSLSRALFFPPHNLIYQWYHTSFFNNRFSSHFCSSSVSVFPIQDAMGFHFFETSYPFLVMSSNRPQAKPTWSHTRSWHSVTIWWNHYLASWKHLNSKTKTYKL